MKKTSFTSIFKEKKVFTVICSVILITTMIIGSVLVINALTASTESNINESDESSAQTISDTSSESSVSEEESKYDIPMVDYNNLSDHEKRIYDFYDSINGGQWEQYASFWSIGTRESTLNFVTKQEYKDKHYGILNVISTKVVSITKLDNSYTPRYPELANYYESEDNYECYLVGIAMTVHEDSNFYFNGINYSLIVLVNDNNTWNIGAESGCNLGILEEMEGVLPVEDAIKDYKEIHGIK
ncbi:MAG: hypothetical protein A2Y17_05195 [Clostridiales bacterium GWF2_38_85]|nr:MAG: hypothetical protein A2Y17_05195 [Clostridiales bacterium GWF2_38_85]HBL84821.1 hypothetical protein [Clostridiales bacterium]